MIIPFVLLIVNSNLFTTKYLVTYPKGMCIYFQINVSDLKSQLQLICFNTDTFLKYCYT